MFKIPLAPQTTLRGVRKYQREMYPPKVAAVICSPVGQATRTGLNIDEKLSPAKASLKRRKIETPPSTMSKSSWSASSADSPDISWPWDERPASRDNDRQPQQEQEQERDDKDTVSPVALAKTKSNEEKKSKIKKPRPATDIEHFSLEASKVLLSKRGERSVEAADDQTFEERTGDDFELNYSDEFKLFFKMAMSTFNEMSKPSRLRSTSSTNDFESVLRTNKSTSSSLTNHSMPSSTTSKLVISVSSTCQSSSPINKIPSDSPKTEQHELKARMGRKDVRTGPGCEGHIEVQLSPQGQIAATRECRVVDGVVGESSLAELRNDSLDNMYKTSMTTSRPVFHCRHPPPLQQQQCGTNIITAINKLNDDDIISQSQPSSDERHNGDLSSSPDIEEFPQSTAIFLKKSASASAVKLPISPLAGHWISLSDRRIMEASASDVSRPKDDKNDEAGLDNRRHFKTTPPLAYKNDDVSYQGPMFHVASKDLQSIRHLTSGLFIEPFSIQYGPSTEPMGPTRQTIPTDVYESCMLSRMESSVSQNESYWNAEVDNSSAKMNDKKLFNGRNSAWFSASPPMLTTSLMTLSGSPSPLFADQHLYDIRAIQSMSTLSVCSTNISDWTSGSQFTYCSQQQQRTGGKVNSTLLLPSNMYPWVIPLTASGCPCGFPDSHGQSFCKMTSSKSHLNPVDPRRGLIYEPRNSAYSGSHLDDLPSESSMICYTHTNLEDSQSVIDLSLSRNIIADGRGCRTSPDTKKVVFDIFIYLVSVKFSVIFKFSLQNIALVRSCSSDSQVSTIFSI